MTKKEYQKKYYQTHKKKLKEYQKEYHKINKTKLIKQRKKYYLKNKEEINKKTLEYYLENKGIINKQRKLYRKNNKIKIKQQKHKEYLKHKQSYLDRAKKYGKIYYESHKNKISRTHKKYYENHKEESRPHRTEYMRNRKRTDINFKIRCYLATRLYLALKRNTKKGHTLELLGCSIGKLKSHLSIKFYNRKDGLEMSFDNYGLWHIDHIKSCCQFDLRKKSEQRKCFHYTNLQPLWAEDNLKKSKY